MVLGKTLDDLLKLGIDPSLPGFVDPSHKSAYYLTSRGRLSVAVILNALEYNCPQVQYCPQLYSLTSVARHYLSEVDTYKLMSCLVTSKVEETLFRLFRSTSH